MHDHRRRIVIKNTHEVSLILSNASLANTEVIYVVHYKFWRHILDGDASGFHGAYKLINIHHSVIVLKIFLHVLISEASKYNMCKFYQIASNSLQVSQTVYELFDCTSYILTAKCISLPSECIVTNLIPFKRKKSISLSPTPFYALPHHAHFQTKNIDVNSFLVSSIWVEVTGSCVENSISLWRHPFWKKLTW